MTPPRRGPRRTQPGTARSLLLAVLGELVWPTGGRVWTATVLAAFDACGIGEHAGRQALARASSHGWIASQRVGREVSWQLTDHGEQLMRRGLDRVQSLTAEQPPWDGRWLVLHVSVPSEGAAIRNRLTRRLQWAGFGSVAPGLWMSPHLDREAELIELLAALDLQQRAVTVLGSLAPGGLDAEAVVERAWSLGLQLPFYEGLLDRWSRGAERRGTALLAEHLTVVDEWQHLPYVDPQLPRELLPDGWPGRAAAQLLADRRSAAAAEVRTLWEDLVARTSPA